MSLSASLFHHRWFLKGLVSRQPIDWIASTSRRNPCKRLNHLPFLWNWDLPTPTYPNCCGFALWFPFPDPQDCWHTPPSLSAFAFMAILTQNLLGVGKHHRTAGHIQGTFSMGSKLLCAWLTWRFPSKSLCVLMSFSSICLYLGYLCVYTSMDVQYMCTNVCAGTHAHVFTCMWKLKTIISWVPCTFLDF